MKTIVIGIAGGTGSGKTTLAHRLVEAFGRDEICMLNHDAYYISAMTICPLRSAAS